MYGVECDGPNNVSSGAAGLDATFRPVAMLPCGWSSFDPQINDESTQQRYRSIASGDGGISFIRPYISFNSEKLQNSLRVLIRVASFHRICTPRTPFARSGGTTGAGECWRMSCERDFK